MRLRDIVEINQTGLVADAVTFKMMDDKADNQKLCNGFVFNYDAEKQKESTLGVLCLLRESFHTTNSPNVHLMVQDFGKGKSHFALTLANFFKQPFDSLEVSGILNQIDFATSNKSQAVYEKLRAYKERSKTHLVICISGESGVDLNKLLLEGLRKALEEQGVGGAIAQNLIQKPLSYLQQLSGDKRDQAEQFLAEKGERDLDTMIELLAEDNYEIIPTVVDISEHIEGFAYNFEYNINIENLLEDAIHNLCTGENRRFEGVLILFDELNAYLRTWLRDPSAAGGSALQNITNVCANNRGSIALLCLAQVRPTADSQLSSLKKRDYDRFTTRIELIPTTYEPVASLELVIDNLLRQIESNPQWQEFCDRWNDTLWRESSLVYDQYITAYSANRSWSKEKFHEHLGLGCYPMHPLTAYLLCNLGFAQGRTAIQFIKEDVAEFIKEQPVEIEGALQYVRPVQLIDAFDSNFSQQTTQYAEYEKAYESIAASAEDDEVLMLKAIALYYLSSDKITKADTERHESILSVLTGFSASKTVRVLEALTSKHQVIYYNPGNNTYRFYRGGFNIGDLRRKIEEETKSKPSDFANIINHCRKNLPRYLDKEEVKANRFVTKHRLNSDDWHFQKDIFNIEQFERILSSERSINRLNGQGLIAYFVGEDDEDVERVEKEAEAVLAKAPKSVRDRVIIAIPRRGTRNLARILAMRETLRAKSAREKEDFREASTELSKQLEGQIDLGLQETFDSCTYTCHVIDKIPRAELKQLEPIVSKMLEELYLYVPPVEGQDKLKAKSTAGAKVVSYVSLHLLANDLKEPFPDKSYENLINPVFVRRWNLLKPGNPYTVKVPQEPNVKQAWDTISELTDIGDGEQKALEVSDLWKVLSNAPYGYNELTFTILLASWLAHHRSEVELSGAFGIPQRQRDTITNKTAPLHEWANETNILAKAKVFVDIWVLRGRNKIVRRKPLDITVPNSTNYADAATWIEKIENHLQMGVLERSKIVLLEKKRQQIQEGMEVISAWFEPTIEVQKKLEQDTPLSELASYYAALESKPPAITIKEGLTTVRVAEAQADTWQKTKQSLKERIEGLIESISIQSQSFETPEKGYGLTQDIEYKIQRLSNVSEFPTRLVDSLRSALENVEQRIVYLQQLDRKHKLTEQIQRLYKALASNATQSQYSKTLDSIEALSAEIPEVRQEPIYLGIVADIKSKQDALIRKIDAWQGQFAAISSLDEAIQLSEEVNRARNRFDSEANQQQVEFLIGRIRDRISQQDDESAIETELAAVAQKAKQKLESVSSLNNFSDMVQAYVELSLLTLPSKGATNAESCRQQLQQSQAEGEQVIRQKLEQLCQDCNREIKRSNEYDQRKARIARAQRLVSEQLELSAEQSKIEAALNSLEDRYSDFQKSNSDRIIVDEIQRLRPAAGNTILRCEELVEQIEELRSQLNFPEKYADITDRLINAFQGKRAEYTFNLDDLAAQLPSVETDSKLQQLSNELLKLELVFKGSTEYHRYKTLEETIQTLHEDLEKITALEECALNAQSIASIDQSLIEVVNSQTQLHDSDRFKVKLFAIEESINQRRKQFTEELAQWQQDLSGPLESAAARKIQTQVISSANRYQDSEYTGIYEATHTDADQLFQLLALVDRQKVESIEDCQSEIKRLSEWRDNQDVISEVIEKHIQTVEQNLEKSQQAIENRQRKSAQKWLFNLQDEVAQLTLVAEASEKLEKANDSLKKISSMRSKHEGFLVDEQKDLLRELEQKCQLVRNQNRASKIETLFLELPREERVELYKRLTALLEGTTEVF